MVLQACYQNRALEGKTLEGSLYCGGGAYNHSTFFFFLFQINGPVTGGAYIKVGGF